MSILDAILAIADLFVDVFSLTTFCWRTC